VLGVPLLVLIAALLVIGPVLSTPFYADDLSNSQRSAALESAGEDLWDHVSANTHQWMEREGRFFPVSALENTLIFDTVHARWLYKALQVSSVVVVLGLLGTFVGLLSRRREAGLLAALLAIPGLQLRVWYDPIHSFGMLLPSIAVKVLGALILILLGLRAEHLLRARLAFVGAGLLWTAALLQYEIVYLLFPLPLLLAWHERPLTGRRGWWAISVVALPTFLLGNYVATLRSGATPSPAYEVDTTLSEVLPTAILQVVGSLPGAAAAFSGQVPGVGDLVSRVGPTQVLAALTAGLAAGLLLGRHALDRRTERSLAGIGLALLLLPAGPIAVSQRWQQELDWGLAYLPSFIQSLGGALFATAIITPVIGAIGAALPDGGFQGRPIRIKVWSQAGVAIAFAAVTLIVASGNDWVSDHLQGFRTQQETTDAALAAGILDATSEGDTVLVRRLPGGNEYYTEHYVAWRGGTRVHLIDTFPDSTSACGDGHRCVEGQGQLFALREFVGPEASLVVAVAPVVADSGDPLDPIVSMVDATLFGPRATTPPCGSDVDLPSTGMHSDRWTFRACSGEPAPLSVLVEHVRAGRQGHVQSPTRQVLTGAATEGLFDLLPESSILLTRAAMTDDVVASVQLAGRSDVIVQVDVPAGSRPCSDTQICDPAGRPLHVLQSVNLSDGEIGLISVPVATVLDGDVLVLIDHARLFGPVASTPSCVVGSGNRDTDLGAGDGWTTRACTGPPSALRSLTEWIATGCGANLAAWPPCQQ